MIKIYETTKKYILIPVAVNQEERILSISINSKKIYEYMVPQRENSGIYSFQYYAALPVEPGSEVSLEGEFSEPFWNAIAFSDTIPQNASKRPVIHFVPNTGWINDPNGFYYQDGIYHLYFQHNPMNKIWGNMSWGHATSKDLLHWEQWEDVMFPDEKGTMFSGCAILNDREMLNLSSHCPVFFYTCAGGTSAWSQGQPHIQRAAWSPDQGNTLVKMESVVIKEICEGNRDPKVYWHEETQGYYMVLYLEKYEFAILRSKNLKDWKLSQRFVLEGAWECPDLRKIPIDGGGDAWVFWCADGYYWIGDFDGYVFTPASKRKQAYMTVLPYAAQTCAREDRIISIPWLRTENSTKTYTGVMGLPRELILVGGQENLCLQLKPVRELLEHRKEILWKTRKPYTAEFDANKALEVEINIIGDNFYVQFEKTKIEWNKETNMLSISNCVFQKNRKEWRKTGEETIGKIESIYLGKKPDKIDILIDREILEITIENGLGCIAVELEKTDDVETGYIIVKGCEDANLYEIK